MSVSSLPFLLIFLLGNVLFRICRSRRSQRALFVAANVAFIAQFLHSSSALFTFAGFVLISYFVVRSLPPGRSSAELLAGIFLIVAFFVYVKQYSFLQLFLPTELSADRWCNTLELVGLSYMLFRFIHIAVDYNQGQLESFNLISYANYQLSFFTLVAGPIQRYNDFHEFWEAPDSELPDAEGSRAAWSRILIGAVKMSLLAPFFDGAFESARTAFDAPSQEPLPAFITLFYAFPLFLYLNFSGYTDIVIGCAALSGCRLPENFDRPFASRNILDFWNRWHISLSTFIRDYLFIPLYRIGAEKLPRFAQYVGYLSLFLALLAAGLWHGATSGFAVFGAVQGIGAAMTQAWGDAIKTLSGSAGARRYRENPMIRAISIALTFHVVCFSLLFFSCGAAKSIHVLSETIHPPPLIGASATSLSPYAPRLMALCVLVAIAMHLAPESHLIKGAKDCVRPLCGETRMQYALLFAKAAIVGLIFATMWALGNRDVVVEYQRF